MAFRDDQDALRERIKALEAERDQLQRGLAPVLGRMRARFIAFGALFILGTGVVLAVQQQESEELQHRAHATQDALEACRGQVADAQADAQRARLDAERANAAASAAREAADAAQAARTAIAITAEGVTTSARVAHVTGRADIRVGSSCTVEVTYQPQTSDCHASVVCGSSSLYPRGGGGFFACEIEAGHVMRGHDANPTSVSGDPEIDVALDRGTLTVTDADPDWSVTLRWPGPNPF